MNPMCMRLVRLLKGTRAELALEPAIAALGVPYRFQLPLWIYKGGLRFFPDFALPTLKLVIEVDDPSHDYTKREDAERSAAILETHGWNVVRCTNDEAVRDPVGTVNRLMEKAGLSNRVSRETVLPRGDWMPALATAARARRSRARDTAERTPDRSPAPRRGTA